jgi:hypothetical protein
MKKDSNLAWIFRNQPPVFVKPCNPPACNPTTTVCRLFDTTTSNKTQQQTTPNTQQLTTTPNNKHPTLNIQHPTPNAQNTTYNTQHGLATSLHTHRKSGLRNFFEFGYHPMNKFLNV